MKRKIVGLANGRNVKPAGATCKRTTNVGPSSAVTASGNTSVIQKTMTSAMMAASRCPSGVSDVNGHISTIRNTNGPATIPTLRRISSNWISASVLVGGGVGSADIGSTVYHISRRGQNATALCGRPDRDPALYVGSPVTEDARTASRAV